MNSEWNSIGGGIMGHVNAAKSKNLISGMVWIGCTVILLFFGLVVMRGLEWVRGPIHFHLFGSRGFETQDLLAMPFILAGAAVFGWGLWRRRVTIEARIPQYPLHAFVVALFIGILIGGFVGLMVGTAFDEEIKAILKSLIDPIDRLGSYLRPER